MTDPLSLLPDPVRWLVMAYALTAAAVIAIGGFFILLETLVSHFSAEGVPYPTDRPGEAGAVEADPHSLRPRLELVSDWYPLEEEG